MSTTEPNRAGRGDRPGGGLPRPATPVVAVVVAAVAGLLGLLILKDVKDTSGGGGSSKPAKTTTPPSSSSPTETTTTTEPVSRQGATVVVANSSGVDGAAGTLTTALKNRGYSTASALTGTQKLDITVIMVKDGDPRAAAVAKALLADMGLSGAVQSLPATAPVKGSLGTATVLILLGKDKANQSLQPLTGGTATSAPTVTSTATTKAPTTTAAKTPTTKKP